MANDQAPPLEIDDSLSNWDAMEELIEDVTFKCQDCGSLLKIKTACQTCQENNKLQETKQVKKPRRKNKNGSAHSHDSKADVLSDYGTATSTTVVVPCTNFCGRRMPPGKLQDHLKECKTFDQCAAPGCDWRVEPGRYQDLGEHVLEAHGISEFKPFAVDFSRESFVERRLLTKNDCRYIVRIERPTDSDYVFYNVFRGEKGNVHKVYFDHFVDADDAFFTKVVRTEDKEIEMESVNSWAQNEVHLDTLRSIDPESDKTMWLVVKVIESEAERALRCCTCAELTRPPIYQCVRRHRVCDSCRMPPASGTRCPLCRNPLVEADQSVQSLAFDVYYPCVYRKFGCKAGELWHEIQKHELICPKKVHSCPLDNCSYSGGSIEQFEKHVKVDHPRIWIRRPFDLRFTFTPLAGTFIVYFDGTLFEVEFDLKLIAKIYISDPNPRFENKHTFNMTVKMLTKNEVNKYFCTVLFWSTSGWLEGEHNVAITYNQTGKLSCPDVRVHAANLLSTIRLNFTKIN